MYYVYILYSKKDQQLYTGYTIDLRKRFNEHISGRVTATKNRRPLLLIYYEAYVDKQDAKGREIFLKSGSGKRFLKKQLRHWFKKHSL